MLAIDIETEANPEAFNQLFERNEFVDKPLKNVWKTEKTWQQKRVEHKQNLSQRVKEHEQKENERYFDQLNRAALDAAVSQTLCISVCSEKPIHMVLWKHDSERELLSGFWDMVYATQVKAGKIVSSHEFDIRFLFRRSIALGVELPTSLRLFKFRGPRAYLDDSFISLATVWGAGEYGQRISLDRLAVAFGVEGKVKGVTGATFAQVAKEDFSLAESYALQDSRIVYEIGQKMEQCGLWEGHEGELPPYDKYIDHLV